MVNKYGTEKSQKCLSSEALNGPWGKRRPIKLEVTMTTPHRFKWREGVSEVLWSESDFKCAQTVGEAQPWSCLFPS